MEPYRPIKNYLPGKKIQIAIAIIALGALAYFFAPHIITFFKKQIAHAPNYQDLLTTVPDGDPTTRDTDSDGVPDWQEVAIGLDPRKPQTVAGTPDAARFEIFKNNLGDDLFTQAQISFTDTDKLSLALSGDITQNIQSGTATNASISNLTAAEIINYIEAQKKQTVIFTIKDLNVVDDTMPANQVYAAAIQTALKDDGATKNFATDLKTYLDGGGSKKIIDSDLVSINKTLVTLKSMPVPAAAAPLHLEIVNAVQGVYQAVKGIDVENPDEIVRLATLALLQDYAIRLSTSAGKLPLYFSIALNKNGYVQ